jgi:hypothetical protein
MVDNVASADTPEISADVRFNSTGGDQAFEDFTYQEIMLGESLLTPGLQTSVVAHSYIHSVKNFDLLKKGNVVIKLDQPTLKEYNYPTSLDVSQTVYRLENRRPLDHNNEEMTFRACDPTMLFDAENLVSKSWKCTTPSAIVRYVLNSCLGAKRIEVEDSTPARDYLAENIHPFQVIAQQSNVALANGNDPSFLHYMTYEKGGTHHFKSLYKLTNNQKPIITFVNSGVGSIRGYEDPHTILSYSFPCDFDLLTDLLNGLDEKGKDISSLILFNPLNKMFSMVGNQRMGCGIGGGNPKMSQSNQGTESNQNSCNTGVKDYLKKRQARMNLVERDKIALRLTVPWNPILHAGKVIRIELKNADPGTAATKLNYGSGNYLILHMTHNIKRGGYATTTMDCVSTTVGQGIV